MSSSLTHHRASLQGAGGPGWPRPRSGEALVWGRSHEYLSKRGFYLQVEDSRGVSWTACRSAGDPEAGALGGRSGRWADGSAGAWATGWPFPGGAGLLFQPPPPVLQKVPTWASGPNLPEGALRAPGWTEEQQRVSQQQASGFQSKTPLGEPRALAVWTRALTGRWWPACPGGSPTESPSQRLGPRGGAAAHRD